MQGQESSAVPPAPNKQYVFLNVPYDHRFQDLCLTYTVGVACFGLTPKTTLEIPGGARRLDRILELIKTCKFSIHDLSRIQMDRTQPRTPRFNMSFELGLTVAWQRLGDSGHLWFVFESRQHRLSKSLSDLSGTDVYIHGGTIPGVFQQLCNAFIGEREQPSVAQMASVYRYIKSQLPALLEASGASSIFDGARPFHDVAVAAGLRAEKRV